MSLSVLVALARRGADWLGKLRWSAFGVLFPCCQVSPAVSDRAIALAFASIAGDKRDDFTCLWKGSDEVVRLSPSASRLVLVSPLLSDAEAFAPMLSQALAAGDVASVLLRLMPGDERTLVNRVKMAAAATEGHDTALVIELAGTASDLGQVATRGGADGVHVRHAGDVRALRDRLGANRIVGAGGLTARHDAMASGEAGADYVLFGGPDERGAHPPLADTADLAEWWAGIFETPCIAIAPRVTDCAVLADTGAEFIALAPDAWTDGPAEAVRRALAAFSSRAGALA